MVSGERSFFASRDDGAKQEFWACLALRECSGIGPRRLAMLLSHFGSAYDAIRCPEAWPDAGVPEACAAAFKREGWRQKALLEWSAAKAFPCGIILWSDPGYPSWLRSIADPPPYLYYRGDISLLQNVAVAVVGMRSCSEEGLRAAVLITRGLARAGVTILSGMAKGIDRAAHLAGLEGPGGSIGVLGAGIDVAYPGSNRDLYALMEAKGLLVSEFPPGAGVDARNFPVRNRIISGLSRAVVVVEAALRSGSLNTAKHALEQNRELMAVPGPVSAPTAKGCQELVRKGAKPVFCADDVLRELVPLLAEHVRQGLLARDLERFRYPRPESPSPEGDGTVPAPPALGLLPWKGGDHREKRAAPAVKDNSGAPAAPAAGEGTETRRTARTMGLSGLEAAMYDLVSQAPLHIDDICRALGQDAKTVNSIAVMLEVNGFLLRQPGMRYVAR